MSALFKARDLRVRRGNSFELHCGEISFERGRIACLVGSNGSGKSSLLDVLAFLASPHTGTLEFDGQHVDWSAQQMQRLRRQVTLVAQDPLLFDTSVQGNLVYGPRCRGVRDVDTGALLDSVGLPASMASRAARRLSGGESQRVAIARAVGLGTDAILLDEPTANVDVETTDAIESLLGRLAESGTCIVLSTHDPEQARRLGSVVLRLENGKVEIDSSREAE